jgi:succinate dehydrogenase / fumarate reductase cytochrome b subunit
VHKPIPVRPVSLPLLKLRLPLAGWVSLLHRLSGIMLFVSLPFALYALEQSLSGANAFDRIQQQLAQPTLRVVLLLLVWALAHHIFAGIRHLLMDMHLGVSLSAARRSALWVVACSGVTVLLVAWRLFA